VLHLYGGSPTRPRVGHCQSADEPAALRAADTRGRVSRATIEYSALVGSPIRPRVGRHEAAEDIRLSGPPTPGDGCQEQRNHGCATALPGLPDPSVGRPLPSRRGACDPAGRQQPGTGVASNATMDALHLCQGSPTRPRVGHGQAAEEPAALQAANSRGRVSRATIEGKMMRRDAENR